MATRILNPFLFRVESEPARRPLALCVVEYLTRRWRLELACSVPGAFVLVPSTMFLLFRSQRFDVSSFLFLGVIGAISAFVSGFVARSVQAAITRPAPR